MTRRAPMTKLATLAPRLASIALRMPAAAHSAVPGSDERSRLYHSGQWQRARRRFLAAHPLCALCLATGLVRGAVAVDHIDGHQGDDWLATFWNSDRWQGLCLEHHNAKAAAELAEWRGAR